MNEIAEYSVYSNETKQLQFFIRHDELELGFIYDTYDQVITVLDLKSMKPLEKCEFIESGEITNMFIDYNENVLYYQCGGFHDTLQVEF